MKVTSSLIFFEMFVYTYIIMERRIKKKGGRLEYEYRRYTYVLRILNIVYSSCGNTTNNRASVETWMIAISNFAADNFDEIFSNDVLNKLFLPNIILSVSLMLNSKKSSVYISSVIDMIISIVSEYKSIHNDPCNDARYTFKNGIFKYKDYTHKLSPSRARLLLSRGSSYDIAVMLMRYASILPNGQHWNIPKANYQLYYDDGVRIEGFASPLNAQLISIDPECKFCSLFPDVDRKFGSIGNFFETSFIGQRVSVLPAYTAEIFKLIYVKVTHECEIAKRTNNSVLFYITFNADLRNGEGYNLIKDSPYCTFVGILLAQKHYFTKNNEPGEPPFIATGETAFFAVGYPLPTKVNYDYLFDGMKVGDSMNLEIIKSIQS